MFQDQDQIKAYKEFEQVQSQGNYGHSGGYAEGTCPSCGYCKHCGRKGQYYSQPYPPYTYNSISGCTSYIKL